MKLSKNEIFGQALSGPVDSGHWMQNRNFDSHILDGYGYYHLIMHKK